jgi:hypothetical protein
MFFRRSLRVETENLDEIVFGTGVLASGGGGDAYIGKLILARSLAKYGPCDLLDPARVKDNALVLVVGAIGASTIFLERFPNLDALAKAVSAAERLLGRKVDALVAAEAGGLNATLPISVGLRLGLPVIDADGMGRAFPQGQMMTYGIYGGRASPMFLVDDHLNVAIIEVDDNLKAEQLSRCMVDRMGNSAMAAAYPMSGRYFKTAAVRNVLRLSRDIGRAALTAQLEKRDCLAALVKFFAGKGRRFATSLFEGKIVDVRRETGGGFVNGAVALQGENTNERCIVEFQNENLIASVNGRTAALVPDIITVLESETAQPITTENLRYGQRVAVFGLAAPELLRTPQALHIVGPGAFGINEPYRPIEALAASARRSPENSNAEASRCLSRG